MFRTTIRNVLFVAAVLPAVIVPLGCSSFDVPSFLKRHKFVEAGPENPVVDVVCLWEPAEGRGLDSLPTRGFAGQLLFLTRGSAEPAKVNGEVRVYVFDDQGTLDEQAKPLHQFDFDSASFGQYFYETSFGGAYQLFIPYTRRGSHEARCGLRLRYTPADGGPPVFSKMAEVTLPGAKPKTSAHSWKPEHRQVSADVLHGTGVPPKAAEGATEKGDALRTASDVTTMSGSIPIPAGNRAALTRARLQQLAAELAESTPEPSEGIQQAGYKVEIPENESRPRMRLKRPDR